jgi:hypothetical protein
LMFVFIINKVIHHRRRIAAAVTAHYCRSKGPHTRHATRERSRQLEHSLHYRVARFIQFLGRETSPAGFIKFADAPQKLHVKEDFKLLGDDIIHPLYYVDYAFSIHPLLTRKFHAVAVKSTRSSNKPISSL